MPRKITNGLAGQSGLGNLAVVSGNTLTSASTDTNVTLGTTGSANVTTSKIITVTDTTTGALNSGALTTAGGIGVAGAVNIGGTLSVGGSGINGTAIGATTPSDGSFTTLSATGLATIAENVDVTNAKTGATGTVVHDFSTSRAWYHSGIAANFTVNLTNVPTTNNRQIEVSIYLSQGATAYYVSGFQIDGVAQTINWAGYAPPTPQPYTLEIQTFTLYRVGGAWTVLSTTSSHGLADGSSIVRAAASGAAIKSLTGTTTNGFYWINPGGLGAIQVYIDMNYSGGGLTGGWVLVLSNCKNGAFGGCPIADGIGPLSYSDAVNGNNYNGTRDTNMQFRTFVGARYWTSIGLNVAQFCSGSAVTLNSTGSHNKRYRWRYTGMAGNYGFQGATGVADETSSGAPGFLTYHAANGFGLYTYDNLGPSSCPAYYGYTPFWYGGCWDGNMWGGGNYGSYQDAPFWSGSGSDYFNYMAVYLHI